MPALLQLGLLQHAKARNRHELSLALALMHDSCMCTDYVLANHITFQLIILRFTKLRFKRQMYDTGSGIACDA